ncbi:MAG: OmpA family protein [Crocinitomicaceae bacterium]|nr:OmpA family protein [Crocinitomicaceae bacterium]
MRNIKPIYVLFILISFFSFTQKDEGDYSVCDGMLNIFRTQKFDIQFLGNKGASTTFSEYPALEKITSGNQIWFSFIAPADGLISLDIESKDANLSLLVFDTLNREDVCQQIKTGNAEIIRMLTPKEGHKIGLNYNVTDNYMYPVEIYKGHLLYFVIIADNDKRISASLDFKFEIADENYTVETKEMDFKRDRTAPTFKIKIIDKETKEPLISSLVLKGPKRYEGYYRASEITFDAIRSGKLEFYCEHDGYFQNDSVGISLTGSEDKLLLIEMDPVRSGKSVQIEELEFEPGTSQILEISKPKLRRLRDFLALNSSLNFEIQGHVYQPGEENSLAGQKMSEARAKRVMKYLVDNGIDKKRMTAVGYGNTRPIYVYPKSASEEQANRRVEILIK